jgi:hypothetical protein
MKELDKDEQLYKTNPRGLAQYHWMLNGESNNPYPRGSLESLDYTSAFQQLMFSEDLSA